VALSGALDLAAMPPLRNEFGPADTAVLVWRRVAFAPVNADMPMREMTAIGLCTGAASHYI
jgi:hypothetical protein